MNYQVFAEREKEGWANPKIADAYVQGFGPVVDEAGRSHLAVIGPASKVLDLCCGQGTLTSALVDQGHDVTGLDFSSEMLDRAKSKAPGANLLLGDAQDLPFEDECFDAVVCNFGMMHIPDQPKALSEVARVLKPGGIYSMASWMGPEAGGVFQLVFGAARASMPEGITPPPQPDFFVYGRRDDSAELFGSNGLSMEDHQALPLHWNLASPSELFEIFLNGTVGARVTLMAMGEEARGRVAASIEKSVASDYSDGAGYSVPVPVVHIVARPA